MRFSELPLDNSVQNATIQGIALETIVHKI